MRSAIRRPTLPAARASTARTPRFFAKYLADDAVFCFANADEVVGRDNIEATLGAFYDSIKALRHDRQGLYRIFMDASPLFA
jgi:hypothetical protein